MLTACAEPAPVPVVRDEAGVYEAVLREYGRILRAAPPEWAWDYMLVADHSSWWSDPPADGEAPRVVGDCLWSENLDFFASALMTLRPECFGDFLAQELVPRPLPALEVSYPVRWQPPISAEARKAFISGGIQEAHPGNISLLALSPIGFDASGDQALLEVNANRGWLDSSSTLVLLRRGRRGWYVIARLTYLVS